LIIPLASLESFNFSRSHWTPSKISTSKGSPEISSSILLSEWHEARASSFKYFRSFLTLLILNSELSYFTEEKILLSLKIEKSFISEDLKFPN
jgi:hypothetical protein